MNRTKTVYQNFRNYLDLIYNYAGTISLTRETKPVIYTKNLKTGDILIIPGSPGHVVFIAGSCENKNGEKLFLLSEGFTPAQSIHLLKNPFDEEISPWYKLEVNSVIFRCCLLFADMRIYCSRNCICSI